MEYRLNVKDDTVPVEVEPAGDNALSVSIGEASHEVSYSVIGDHHIRLEIDGKGVNAYVAGGAADKRIVIKGVSYRISDADAAEQASSRKSGVGGAPTDVTPPMPSVVVAVLVKEGDMVDKGQALVVLSAMKMETTLYAPFTGKVAMINTSEGAKVMPGDILVNIEKDGEEG